LVPVCTWQIEGFFHKEIPLLPFANGIRKAFTHDGMDDTGCSLEGIREKRILPKEFPCLKV